jgi:hypothetical protein
MNNLKHDLVVSKTFDEKDGLNEDLKVENIKTSRNSKQQRESRLLKSPLETTVDNFKQVFKREEHATIRELFSAKRAFSEDIQRKVDTNSNALKSERQNTRLMQLLSPRESKNFVVQTENTDIKQSVDVLLKIYSKISKRTMTKRYQFNHKLTIKDETKLS